MLSCLTLIIVGCVSFREVNEGFRRIVHTWQLEYKKEEDSFRYRVIDAPYNAVFPHIKNTVLDLEIPVQRVDVIERITIAENETPHPLTRDEWENVRVKENPRVKRLGGWMFYLAKDPKGYFVTMSAGVRPVGNKTNVLLKYELDMPKYEELGITLP